MVEIVGPLQLGLVSGYFLGWTGTIISQGVDVLMAFPYFLLALTMIAILGPGLLNGILASGRQYLSAAPHTSYLPGMVIFLTVLGFNLLGDGLRDALDPRMRES